MLPTRRGVLAASVKLSEAELAEARVDLARTVIRLPFTARIAEATVEAAQFVRSGDRLVVADSIDLAEVEVQVPLERMRPLIPTGFELTNISDRELAQLTRRLGLTAQLRLPIQGIEASWQGRFDRISDTIDPRTRTLGVIVAVDQPYRTAIPGVRPPLTKNMFVQVELAAPPRDARLVIPSIALQSGAEGGHSVLLVGTEQRLERRQVVPGVRQGDLVVIDDGLAPGDRVVVSDLVPAIEGMLLAPSLDGDLVVRLTALAEAAEPLE